MNPYDNKEYRYRHGDESSATGVERVAALLGLPRPLDSRGIQFDLSFLSGGSGVFDRHAIALPANPTIWTAARTHLSAKAPQQCFEDDLWSAEFKWLVCKDGELASIDDAAISFVNSERRNFQLACTSEMTILFQACSNVNDWAVLWGTDARLNYLGFSQG